MLELRVAHGIVPTIWTIPIQEIDRARDRMQKSHVNDRFVADNASLT